MIASTGLQANLQGALDTLAGDGVKSGGSGDFLQTLRGLLPDEAQTLSPEDLLAWLERHAFNLMPLAAPATAPAELAELAELAAAAGEAGQDPLALLGALIDAGRQEAASFAAGEEAAVTIEPTAGDGMAALLQNAGARAAENRELRGDVPEFTLRTPVQHPDFSQALGERLTWLVRQDVQQARIQLEPAELGPLEISLSIKDDQASVTISAQHPLTREVLEADSQRLRAMLGDSGFTMVDVNVSQGWRQHQDGERAAAGVGGAAEPAIDQAAAEQGALPRRGRGLIDHYA